MGKQINFYMDDKIKQDFINFLDAEGYVFLPDSSFDILYKLEKENINNEYSVCLYTSLFGKIKMKQIKDINKFRIDKSYNPVIEYWIPHIKHSDKSIRCGRLWLTSYDFYDKNADRTFINKEYNKLVRWIKENVPYQKVSGYSQKMYISDELVDLLYNSEYILK